MVFDRPTRQKGWNTNIIFHGSRFMFEQKLLWLYVHNNNAINLDLDIQLSLFASVWAIFDHRMFISPYLINDNSERSTNGNKWKFKLTE